MFRNQEFGLLLIGALLASILVGVMIAVSGTPKELLGSIHAPTVTSPRGLEPVDQATRLGNMQPHVCPVSRS